MKKKPGKKASKRPIVQRESKKRVRDTPASKNLVKQAKPVLAPTPKPLQKQVEQSLKPTILREAKVDGHREGTGYKMAVDRIEGETVIGDLIVVFPRTREALLRHGLKLDVDEAGDIYMTLDAFSAIHGLKIDSLIRELVEISKQPPPVTPAVVQGHPQAQIASPPTT